MGNLASAKGIVIDLFCGAGLLSYPFAERGLTVLGVDKDPHVVAPYKRNVGEAVQVDVAEVDDFGEFLGVGGVAVVLAGLLCQDCSPAGRRLGNSLYTQCRPGGRAASAQSVLAGVLLRADVVSHVVQALTSVPGYRPVPFRYGWRSRYE